MLSLRSSVRKHLSAACSITRKELRPMSAIADVQTPSNPVELAAATHVLTLPMYANPEVWAKMEEFRQILINDAPNTGLDPNTVMPSIKRVLEYKLGRLVIKNDSTTDIPHSCELSQVMKVLEDLKEPIRKVLIENEVQGDLRLPLGDTRPRNSNNKVLLLHGIRGKELNAAVAINSLVFKAFADSGTLLARYRVLIPDTNKTKSVLLPIRTPSHLCSTIINSNYAKDRKPGEPLKSFNLQAIYTSSMFKPWPPTEISPQGNPFMRRVELGAACIPGLYLRPCNSFGDPNSQELIHTGKIDFADC